MLNLNTNEEVISSMKICPKCQTQNENHFLFCQNCGEELGAYQAEAIDENHEEIENPTENNSSRQVQNSKIHKRSNFVWLGVLLTMVAVILSLSFFTYSLFFSGSEKETALSESSTPEESTTISTETVEQDNSELDKYDAIVSEAKRLTIEEEFKESELKLAEIPISVLEKEEFAHLKAVVAELNEQNRAGIARLEETEETEDSSEEKPLIFAGDLARWATNYVMYYTSSQGAMNLSIAADGTVTMTDSGGTQEGTAEITKVATTQLSYDTTATSPTSQPETKQINGDVRITIIWEDNSLQELYGYLSYSSRLVLTDGIGLNNGVNEVWITN